MAEDPHAEAPDEDLQDHIGDVILDPWDDDDQPDWPNETVKVAI